MRAWCKNHKTHDKSVRVGRPELCKQSTLSHNTANTVAQNRRTKRCVKICLFAQVYLNKRDAFPRDGQYCQGLQILCLCPYAARKKISAVPRSWNFLLSKHTHLAGVGSTCQTPLKLVQWPHSVLDLLHIQRKEKPQLWDMLNCNYTTGMLLQARHGSYLCRSFVVLPQQP